MKTAISIPEQVFRSAERLAKRLRKSRSQLYSEAIAEYIARRAPAEVTEAYDAIADQVDTRPDRPLAAATRRLLRRNQW